MLPQEVVKKIVKINQEDLQETNFKISLQKK